MHLVGNEALCIVLQVECGCILMSGGSIIIYIYIYRALLSCQYMNMHRAVSVLMSAGMNDIVCLVHYQTMYVRSKRKRKRKEGKSTHLRTSSYTTLCVLRWLLDVTNCETSHIEAQCIFDTSGAIHFCLRVQPLSWAQACRI